MVWAAPSIVGAVSHVLTDNQNPPEAFGDRSGALLDAAERDLGGSGANGVRRHPRGSGRYGVGLIADGRGSSGVGSRYSAPSEQQSVGRVVELSPPTKFGRSALAPTGQARRLSLLVHRVGPFLEVELPYGGSILVLCYQ